MSGFENSAGLGVLNFYGPRTTEGKYGGRVDDDVIKVASWTFTYDKLPTYGSDNLEMSIPANAKILSAYLEIITPFTSTSTLTDLQVGLYTSAGVAIDAAGLVTAANADQTAIGTQYKLITGTGSLVGATIGTTAGEVVVAPTVADLLTGKARLVVRYLPAAS